MGRFPDALRSALAEMGWSMGELARRSSAVTQPAIGRYISGSDLPRPATLDQLSEPFPPRIREELAAAYLSEHVPASIEKRLRISIAQEGGGEPVPFHLDGPPPGSHNAKVIATLAREIMRDPNLALVLDYLASNAEGRAPISDTTGQDLTVRTVEEQARIDAAEKELAEQERNEPPAKRVRYRKPDPGKGT